MSCTFFAHPKLISYQGIVTKISLLYEKYELDKTVTLYTTFCPHISHSFEIGSEVLVSNAHAIKIKGDILLVCCDYSFLEIINDESLQVKNLFSRPNVFYSLGFLSLFWIEKFSLLLQTRFATLLGTDAVSFENNSDLLESVIQFFYGNQSSLERKQFPDIHKCSAFDKETPLPFIADISSTISSIKDSALWFPVNKDWKFSITKEENKLLVGALLTASDGSLHLADTSGSFPLFLTDHCDHGLCSTIDLPRLVVLQNYDLVIEYAGEIPALVYLCTSYCRLHSLLPSLDGGTVEGTRSVLVLSRLQNSHPSYLVCSTETNESNKELCSDKEASNKLDYVTAQLEALTIGGGGVEEFCFKSPQHLFPGHVYRLGERGSSPVHDPKCEGNHAVLGYAFLEICSIKDLFLKKSLGKMAVIIGVLIDKYYIQEKNTAQCTLRLRLQDVSSRDSILAYISSPPENLVGLLPCTVLELYRFSLCQSRTGGLYLKASRAFGIEVKRTAVEWIRDTKGVLSKELYVPSVSAVFHSPQQKIFLVEKIMSVEVFVKCPTCETKVKCPCSFQNAMSIKVMATLSDGIDQFLAFCCGGAAAELLCIEEKHWRSIASFMKITRKPLKYSEKILSNNVCLLPILNQVFHHYCSSKATLRQVIAEYILMPNPDPSKMSQNFVWCKSVKSLSTSRAMLDFYKKLNNKWAS